MRSVPSSLSSGAFLPPPFLQAFPLLVPGHVPPLLPSLVSLFIYSSCGKWAFHHLLWSFLPTATFTSFPAPGCWACATAPAFSSQLVYWFTVPWRIAPPPLFSAQGAPPSLLPDFFVIIAYYTVFFFFFPWVGVSLSRGLCWSGPGLSDWVPCAA
jgi:hypothetical protein